MKPQKSPLVFGWRVYGVGVAALGLACLTFGDFDPGSRCPKTFPCVPPWPIPRVAHGCRGGGHRMAPNHRLGCRGADRLLRFLCPPADNGRLLLNGYAVYGTYEGIAMQLAIAASALILYANSSQINTELVARLSRLGKIAFGICCLVWGGAHFVYMNLTAPLVPKWLPPGQVFWGYVTGVCFIAAGVAILVGIKARLAAILLTIMIASFGLLANGPMLVADPSSHWNWTESTLNLALIGAAWVVADSLAES